MTAESFRQECDRLNRDRGVLRAEPGQLGRAWAAGGRVCAGAQALTPCAPARFSLSATGHGESMISAVRLGWGGLGGGSSCAASRARAARGAGGPAKLAFFL